MLSVVVFLEALVNETFQDAADGNASRIAPLDHRCIELMGEFWNSPKGRRAGVLRKFQKALLLADRKQLNPDAAPSQNAKLLIDPQPSRAFPAGMDDGWGGNRGRSTSQGQVCENALMAGMGNPWFPDKCLGAGCAQWSWKTSLALADEWTKRLGILRPYQADNDSWSQP